MNLKWWCFYWDFWVSFFLRLYEYYDMYYNVIILFDKVKFFYLNVKKLFFG